MSRAERLFGLAQYLDSKSGRTVADIAQRFAVSERTVFRDLASLEQQGVPLECHEGRYRILRAASRPLALDSGELALVRVALANPGLARRATMARALAALLGKLDRALRGRRSVEPDRSQSRRRR
jgi:predicted DNA-binding transcriptional regulator YafY